MILTCPACSTRYQADEAKFPPDGRQVRCAKCGHVWHQAGLAPAQPAAEPAPAIAAPAPDEADPAAPDLIARARAQLAGATNATPTPAKPRRPLLSLLAVVAGWAGLIAVVLLIGLSAVRYRQEITMIWPQSASVYSRLGIEVNTHGIDFIHVDYHRESEDGQVVLAVTGQIVNNGARELPVPQSVRIGLSDVNKHELFHWNFTPGAQSLKPGQSIAFTTRLSSPPPGARHLEMRFAPPGK
ncbi:MAG TPA: zinc-ribbon domain-containing protein [Rhizomicrobium sp.]|nr:zinc-ribbon domain-containing protein [Rhizomicrobium sp.]